MDYSTIHALWDSLYAICIQLKSTLLSSTSTEQYEHMKVPTVQCRLDKQSKQHCATTRYLPHTRSLSLHSPSGPSQSIPPQPAVCPSTPRPFPSSTYYPSSSASLGPSPSIGSRLVHPRYHRRDKCNYDLRVRQWGRVPQADIAPDDRAVGGLPRALNPEVRPAGGPGTAAFCIAPFQPTSVLPSPPGPSAATPGPWILAPAAGSAVLISCWWGRACDCNAAWTFWRYRWYEDTCEIPRYGNRPALDGSR